MRRGAQQIWLRSAGSGAGRGQYAHWKDFVWAAASDVAFLCDTRLRFLENGVDCGKGAPMACAMVYWGRSYEAFFDVFVAFGAVVDVKPLHGVRVGAARNAAGLLPPAVSRLARRRA